MSADEPDEREWEAVEEGTVEAARCDHLGHLNARFHAHLFEDARPQGATGDTRREDIRVDFRREVLCGADYRVMRNLRDAEGRVRAGRMRLVDRESDVVFSDYRWHGFTD